MGGIMSSLILSGDTSGTVTVSVPAVAGTNTATLPAATGTVMVSGNMPAFSAYQSAAQTISNNTQTKVQCNTEEFDTNSNYDNATNYRFTPTVAGYYQVSGSICFLITGSNAGCEVSIWKNGARFKAGVSMGLTTGGVERPSVSTLIYMNGSTDYIEFYAYQSSGLSTNINTSSGIDNYFQAVMVRSA